MKQFLLLFLVCSLSLVAMEKSQQTVQKWEGAYYDEYSKPQFEVAITYLQNLDLSNYRRILDVGCGTGNVAAYIAHEKAPHSEVVGVEPDQSMISRANVKWYDVPNLSFVQSSAEELSLHRPANLIVSFATFHWIENQQEAFIKMRENLLPGGEFHMIMTSQSDPLHVEARNKTMFSKKWQDHFNKCYKPSYFPNSKINIEELLKRAGFSDVTVQEVDRIREFKNIDEVKSWLRGFIDGFTGVSELSTEQKEEFLDDIIENYKNAVDYKCGSKIKDTGKALVAVAKLIKETQEL